MNLERVAKMERITLEQAIEVLVQQTKKQTKTNTVSVFEALNQVLAHDVYAPINVPSFNRSAMDGYAVKASETAGASHETPIKLQVIKQLMAGDYAQLKAESNQAVRVMTGSYIPDGFDAVIRQEDTNYGDEVVELYASVKPFMNYSAIGEDIKQGQLMLQAGTVLTPIHLGILASLGMEKVEVLVPIKVGLISSGSELAEAPEALKPGQIYDSNRFVLTSRLKELNVEVVFSKKISDDPTAVASFIKEQMKNVDLVITTGGVSVGKKDIMHEVISQLEANRLFWRINMRPGTPVLASLYQDKLILGLSGNPFAALTTFELLFRPILSQAMHTNTYTCVRKQARFKGTFNKGSKQRRFIRAYYEDGVVSIPTGEHASSVLSSMLGCNCFIDIEAGNAGLAENETVEVVLL